VKIFGSKTYGHVIKGILYKEMVFFSIQFAKFEPDITIIRSATSCKSLVINNTLLQRLMVKQQQAILPTVIRTDDLMALRPHSTGTWLPHHRWSIA